ncbi:MAG TPA: D-amino acid aminotransferase [Burkholderiaceae bacterium]|nr:D-amino acid aminotransferase [Burkholderiaceae bacterium]
MNHPLFPADLDPQAPAFLNGRWLALSEAQVSVLDRGFLFGDGIYEVVPVYSRKPFAWAEHLGRLQRSLSELSLAQATADVDWDGIVQGLIERAPTDDQFIYLQVTRGVARRDHSFPRPAVPPTIFAMVSPLKRPAQSDRELGLKAVRMPDQRWLRCDIKSVALLGNVLAREAAVAQGAHEAILFRDGLLTEGAASNIWVVRQGLLLSPPRSNQLLAGIRMAILPRLAKAVGVPFESRAISEAEVVGADELLMSSATKEVLPITQLDGQAVGQGRPGPVFQALRAAYDDAIAAHRA